MGRRTIREWRQSEIIELEYTSADEEQKSPKEGQPMKPNVLEKTGKIEEMDRSFDLQFWQAQSDTARFAAAWELVVQSFLIKGKDVSQLRLQRTIECFGRQPG